MSKFSSLIQYMDDGDRWTTSPNRDAPGFRTIKLSQYNDPGTTIMRDSNGRSQVSDPEDDLDIANKEFVERRINGLSTATNLENGIGKNSLQQKYIVDGTDYSAQATGENAIALGGKRYDKLTDTKRTPTSAEGNQSFAQGASSHAYGDYAVAMTKDNKSYQAASFTAGGGNQTGRTEKEFNAFYWDSINNVGLHGGSKDANGNILDAYGDTYAKSYSFGATFGEVNFNRGRDSIVGGIRNQIDALYSLIVGDRNVSINGAKHIVSGFNNTVSDTNNTVNGDSNTVAGPDNIVSGYKNNVNGLANTINGASNTAEGDYNLIEGQLNITASRNSTILGYENAIGYTRDDNLSNAQKTAQEVRDEFVAGAGNTASHGNGGLIGIGLKTGRDEQVAVGVANAGKSNTVFEVGNGSYTHDSSGGIHITNRKNAFAVLQDGRAKVQSAPTDDNDVARLKEIKAINIKNGSGLNSLEQNKDSSYSGIAIKTKNPNAYAWDNTLTDNEPIGAVGDYTSSFGGVSSAQGKRAHSEGTNTVAKGKYSHAEGDNSVALGNDSHAEGITTVAKGQASHSEGSTTQATGYSSHAEGIKTVAEGNYSHAEGNETIAHGSASHSEGTLSAAIGDNSHAEGRSTSARGNNSHSEGYETTAAGDASHTEGTNTNANAYASHAEGEDTSIKTVLPISSSGDSGSDSSGSTGNPDDTNWNINNHLGEKSHAEGTANTIYGYSAHAEGFKTTAFGHMSHVEGSKTQTGKNKNGTIEGGTNAHAEGNGSLALGNSSHAEGRDTQAIGENSHAEGRDNVAGGIDAHAEGANTNASGNFSHTEGINTSAIGESSHAEGNASTASGINSHAEGQATIASGECSHTEGKETKALHFASHSSGVGTKTSADNQFVHGTYNADNTKALFIIGNGNGDNKDNRKNAFEVLFDGRAKVQSAPVDDDDVVRKKEISGLSSSNLYLHNISFNDATYSANIGCVVISTEHTPYTKQTFPDTSVITWSQSMYDISMNLGINIDIIYSKNLDELTGSYLIVSTLKDTVLHLTNPIMIDSVTQL